VVQAVADRLRGQRLDLRGRQLQCQGQTVQAHADLGHGLRVGGGQGERAIDRLCPGQKQHDGGRHRHRRRLQRTAQVGHPQRRDGQLMLPAEAQRFAAGDQDLELGGRGDQDRHVGGGVHHMLEAIQDQQEVLLP